MLVLRKLPVTWVEEYAESATCSCCHFLYGEQSCPKHVSKFLNIRLSQYLQVKCNDLLYQFNQYRVKNLHLNCI